MLKCKQQEKTSFRLIFWFLFQCKPCMYMRLLEKLKVNLVLASYYITRFSEILNKNLCETLCYILVFSCFQKL